MNFIVLGTSMFSIVMTDALLDMGVNVHFVTLKPHLRPENSVDVEQFCVDKGINCINCESINDENTISILKKIKPDFILSSWPAIISREVLNIPHYFVIGTHPTFLPIGRGRHPLHWAISMNIKLSAISFFKMNEKIDGGELIIQEPFILPANINDANISMSQAAVVAIKKMLPDLKNFKPVQTEQHFSNYWPKRDLHDVTLDPRLSCDMAIRVVRSFVSPYSGARLYVSRNQYLTINSAFKINDDSQYFGWEFHVHGHIFANQSGLIDIRFDDGVLRLAYKNDRQAEIGGSRIHPPAYYFCKEKNE